MLGEEKSINPIPLPPPVPETQGGSLSASPRERMLLIITIGLLLLAILVRWNGLVIAACSLGAAALAFSVVLHRCAQTRGRAGGITALIGFVALIMALHPLLIKGIGLVVMFAMIVVTWLIAITG